MGRTDSVAARFTRSGIGKALRRIVGSRQSVVRSRRWKLSTADCLARPLPMIRSWQAALLDWRPAALIGICVALIVLCAQVPFRYSFEVGRGTGPASDLPFMQGFHEAEGRENHQGFRWSKAQEARIEIPGIGRRGVIADLAIVSHRAQWLPGAPPTVLTLRSGDTTPFSFPLRLQGAHYLIYLPPAAL